jgi:hypothetical protein
MAYGSNYTDLARRRLRDRLALLPRSEGRAPRGAGWITRLREALGRSAPPPAQDGSLAQTFFSEFEREEIEANVTLKMLREVADRSDCTLIYALVPNALLEEG